MNGVWLGAGIAALMVGSALAGRLWQQWIDHRDFPPATLKRLMAWSKELSDELQGIHADEMEAAGIPASHVRNARLLALTIRDDLAAIAAAYSEARDD